MKGKENAMPSLKKDLCYPRRMVVYAVFDVLDQMRSRYEQTMLGDIKAEVRVRGNAGLYAFAVTELTENTSILHITMLQSMASLTEEEKELAVRCLMDRILQHIGEAQQSNEGKT